MKQTSVSQRGLENGGFPSGEETNRPSGNSISVRIEEVREFCSSIVRSVTYLNVD